ncbi:MAG: hypothetical protein ACHQNV_01750 [Vicinamibacteria bacterium]
MLPLPIVLGVAAALAWLGFVLYDRRLEAHERETVRRTWGADVVRTRPFPLYREWFLSTEGAAASEAIDDQTWLDLDLDRVFARADRTLSGPGRFVLYRLLRTPTSTAVLASRDGLMDLFQWNEAARDVVRGELSRAGRHCRADGDLADLLWGDPVQPGDSATALAAFGLLGAVSLGAAFVYGGGAIPAAVVVFAVNGYIHQRARIRHQGTASALVELGALLRSAHGLSLIEDPALGPWRRRLQEGLRATRRLLRPLSLISAGHLADMLYEYISVLLLLEARALRSALRRVADCRRELRELFMAVGELDALQSAASFRQSLAVWSKPRISDRPAFLAVEGAVHPLLERPEGNSITLDHRGCLVTGANMAGKSTFLRVLGVNAVLAQTLYTCAARGYVASPLRVLSSMGISDSLAEGRSLFLAEAERILEIVRASTGETPTLCLIDEMLTGTNTADRSVASRAVLAYLARRNAIVVAATHDPELSDGLREVLEAYHFDDTANAAGDMRHQLRPGITRDRNAFRLLAELGYPAEVIAALKAPVTRSS